MLHKSLNVLYVNSHPSLVTLSHRFSILSFDVIEIPSHPMLHPRKLLFGIRKIVLQ